MKPVEILHAHQRRPAFIRDHDLRDILQSRARLLGGDCQSAIRILVLGLSTALCFVLPLGPSMASAEIRRLRRATV